MKSEHQVSLIVHRMANHAAPSGYHRLADYLDADIIQPPGKSKIHQRIIVRGLRRLIRRSGSQWYHHDNLYQELTAAWRWRGRRTKIFHFLYGENSYRYLGWMKKIADHKIMCTFHTPPDKFKNVVRAREHLRHIDIAVVVSRSQIDFFSDILGPEKVVYIPHGIDTDYFTPSSLSKNNTKHLRCLFVGTHLRDFETLAKSAVYMNRQGIKFSLTVVTSTKNHHHFENIKNISCLSGISDEALLDLYRESDILLFPLLGSTANNTLLEAMACGLPIITTAVDGVYDYINEASAILVPKKDVVSIAEAVAALEAKTDLLDAMAQAGRERSLQFNWPLVADQIKNLYVSCCNGPDA